jgi:hypothetical protein
MIRAMRAVATMLGLLALCATSAAAQDRSAADLKEIRAYRLTTASLDRFEKLVDAMMEFTRKDASFQANIRLQAEVDSLRGKPELSESEQARLEKLERQLEHEEDDDELKGTSIDEMAAELAKIPGIEAVLKRGGMTPREYLVFSLALFEASAYAEMKKSGMIKETPKEVNAGNVKFAEDHAARLKAITERAQRIGKIEE